MNSIESDCTHSRRNIMANPFHDPASATIQNLESAFAGESMAHIK